MILLVNPPGMKQGPYFDVPTNLLSLAGSLREAGIEYHISDGNLIGFDGVKLDIDRLGPDVVGISCLSPVRFSALQVAEYAKSKGAMTVFGGHHGHWMPEQVLSYPYMDVVVFGEGENTVVDLCRLPLPEVKGIAYKDGGVRYTEKRQ